MKPEQAVGFQVKGISNLIRRRMYGAASQQEGFTEMQAMVIAYLYDRRSRETLFQRDIETAFSIRRSTATGILKLMEKNGYLTREPVAFDARLKKLELTPKAIALHQAITREICRIEEQITSGFSDGELETLLSLLNRVKQNLERR